MARPWNPEFTPADRERWICIYPLYINNRRSVSEGRRIPKDKAVDNPTYTEMRDVLGSSGLTIGVENKIHPKEHDPRNRGRIRVQLRNETGDLIDEKFPDKRSVMLYIGGMIPKLKARLQSQSAAGSQQQQGGGQKKGKGKKGKR